MTGSDLWYPRVTPDFSLTLTGRDRPSSRARGPAPGWLPPGGSPGRLVVTAGDCADCARMRPYARGGGQFLRLPSVAAGGVTAAGAGPCDSRGRRTRAHAGRAGPARTALSAPPGRPGRAGAALRPVMGELARQERPQPVPGRGRDRPGPSRLFGRTRVCWPGGVSRKGQSGTRRRPWAGAGQR